MATMLEEKTNKKDKKKLIKLCPNCGKEHDSDEWNGYCSKTCWWGFPVDYRCYVLGGLSALNLI